MVNWRLEAAIGQTMEIANDKTKFKKFNENIQD